MCIRDRRRMCRDIRETEENTMEAQMVSSEKLEELTEVLLYQELSLIHI